MTDFRKRDEKPLMKDIDNHVVGKWATKWKELGSQLNVGEYLIRNIEYDHPNDCERCCRTMLSNWLEQTAHPTWGMLISALDQVSDNAADTHLRHASNYLCHQYIDGRFADTEDDWPPYQPKHYTTLALIHHENSTDAKVISVSQKLATEGNISKVLPTNSKDNKVYNETTKSLAEIFTFISPSTVNSNMILIEGAPGIGKTVLSKEIAFLWASNKLLNCIKILLLVFIRNLYADNVKSLNGFMHHIFRNTKIANDVGEYFYNNGGKDLAIVLDGYDEISETDKSNSFINDIINRKVFTKCLLVITSRPTASSCLHNIVNYRIEIVGFTEEDRLKYIETALPNSRKKVEDLQLYLHANPTINALCYIPLNMTILLCLSLKSTENLPKTQTDLYRKFIEMTVIRFFKKYSNKPTGVHINIFELPNPHNNVLKELMHLAFKALQEDRLIFTLNELKVSCPNLTAIPNNWNGLGLLKSVKYFNFDKSEEVVTYHFLHFSIQEYMAAYYISTLSNSQQIKLMRSTFWTIRYYNTWIMYVGITGGESFALKHFLSGNWFHFFTRFSKPSISKKLVSNKIKHLHMFQCLAETRNHDMISLVGNFFENQEIDLSSQTLLPSDLNTLGFFLIRSVCKHWKMLNLSHCNIGNSGSTSLSERLSDKGAHQISIEKVDLSYNLLNLQSVVKLFELFKCWNVSELIITDITLLNIITSSSKLYSEIEYNFIQFNVIPTLQLASIGSFLFTYTVDRIKTFISSTVIKSMYLLNCNLNCINNHEFLYLFQNQNLENFHLLNTSVTKYLTEIIALLNINKESHALVYDSNLSNQKRISSSTWNKNQKNSFMVIIGKYTIEGIIITHSLSSKLSNLEILNLIVKMRSLCCSSVPVVNLWRHDLQFYGDKSESIIQSFIQFLPKITSNIHLKIKLIEGRTFIAHQMKYKDIHEDIMIHVCSNSLPAIYLNSCDFIESNVYENNVLQETLLSSFTVLNSNLDFRTLLSQSTELKVKYLFLHSSNHSSNLSLQSIITSLCNTSMVLLTKDVLTVCNPTNEQLALAYQLESSFTVWKFFGNFHSEVFYLILTMLTQRKWDELDFSCCNIGNTEYKIINEYTQINKCELKIDAIIVPSLKFVVHAFAKFLTTGNIEKVTIFSNDTKFYDHLIKKVLENAILIGGYCQEAYALSILCNNRKTCFFYNVNWNKIIKLLDKHVTSLFMVECELNNETVSILCKLDNLSQMYLIGGKVNQETMPEFLTGFKNKHIELSILNTTIRNSEMLYNSITDGNEFYKVRYENCVVSVQDAIYGFNVRKQQLHFLKCVTKRYFTITEHKFIASLCNTKQNFEVVFFVFKNHQLNLIGFINKNYQAINLISILKFSTLTTFGIENCSINNNCVRDIIKNNPGLEMVYLNNCFHNTDSLVTILTALCGSSTLKALEIVCNKITDLEADVIVTVISQNTTLQVLNLNGNNLQAKGIIKIAKSLRNTSVLTKLFISSNNISQEAADEMAHVLSCNPSIQELDLSNNCFYTIGTIKIMKALKTCSTLTVLNISHNSITEDATEDIAAVISHNTKLQVVKLNGNYLRIKSIAQALKNTFTLQSLEIESTYCTKEAVDDLAAVLSQNLKLQVLNLSENDLQTEGINIIARALSNTYTLQSLKIQNINCTEMAADDIANVLSHNTNLRVLNLNENNLQTMGIKKISKALCNTCMLQSFEIAFNNCTEKATNYIAAVLSRNVNLEVLNLNGNNFKASQIAGALQNTCTLQILELYTVSTEEEVYAIATVLFHNANLQMLSLSVNHLHSDGILKIAQVLSHRTTLKLFKLDGNYLQVETILKALQFPSIMDNICIKNMVTYTLHGVKVQTFWTCRKNQMKRSTKVEIQTSSTIDLVHNNYTDELAHDVAGILFHNINLQVLNLNGNKFRVSDIQKIATALKNTFTLQELQLESINCTEQAADDIATLLSHNLKLQVLNLGRNNLQVSGIQKIATALKNTFTLQELQLENINCTEQAADDIATVLIHNVNLKILNISGNNFQANGIIKLMKGLQNTFGLCDVMMCCNNCTEEAAHYIAAVLSNNTELQVVNLNGNYLKTKGITTIAQALKDISTLQSLEIEYNGCTKHIADDLATVLSHNVHIKVLNLNGNDLQAQGIQKIAKSLHNTYALQRLEIGYNNCTEAADDIAAVLSHNVNLQVLNLNGNYFQANGIKKIANALSNAYTLQSLEIEDSYCIGEAAYDIATILSHNKKLQVLNLSGNNLGTNGIKLIANALEKNFSLQRLEIGYNNCTGTAANDLACALFNNTNLHVLNLTGNNLEAKEIITIIRGLRSASNLQTLELGDNNCTDEVIESLAAVLSCSTNIHTLNLSRNGITKEGIITIMKSLRNNFNLRRLILNQNAFTDEEADYIEHQLSNIFRTHFMIDVITS